MSCVEKACVWPAEANGYCVFHARMFEEVAGRYATVKAPNIYPRPKAAEHILLHGIIFRRKDKEPFEKSGLSLLGALEYDQESDHVKCHECGEFRKKLGRHIIEHEMTGREYRRKHGLSSKTPLCGLFSNYYDGSSNFKTVSRKQYVINAARARKARTAVPFVYSVETRNLRNKCRAQILSRIKEIADKVGRTPKEKEIRESGLHPNSVRLCFGSMAEAMKLAGLVPRIVGQSEPSAESYQRLN